MFSHLLANGHDASIVDHKHCIQQRGCHRERVSSWAERPP